MNRHQKKNKTRTQRLRSVRGHIHALADVPRLSVFRSNTSMYAQVIDDAKGVTVASARLSETAVTKKKEPGARILRARELGGIIAERALKAGVKKVAFDRGQYAYHGRVQALAEGAREKGLQF